MRFRALADLGDMLMFSSLGIGIFLAVAGTLAAVPEGAAVVAEADEPFLSAPVRIDASMFSAPEPELEAELEAAPETLAEAAPEEEPAPVRAPRPSRRVERPDRTEAVAVAIAEPLVATESATPKAKKKKPSGGRKPCTEAPDPLIRSLGGDSWEVRKGVVQRYTRDWSNLDDLGWSQPHDGPDGRGDGLQIGGIRCGSDVWDAGFRSGDVIHSVNGRSVKSIPQALLVYAAIHGADRFRVEITRKGEKRTLTYRLGTAD